MLNISGFTLCIVGSPFQCLCMIEALHYFNITDYDVLVGYSDKLSLGKIEALLNTKGICYTKAKTAHVVKDILQLRKTFRKRYTNFIIADFDNRNGYSIACLLAKINATICYIDDGAQAYQFFAKPPVRKKYKISVESIFLAYSIIGKFKRIKKPIYYTVYDVTSENYQIIRNEMTHLRVGNRDKKEGVYIVGTNSSALDFKNYSYFDYLDRLFTIIRNNYVDTPIFYCPHRRDLNNQHVLDFCRKKCLNIFETEISVEYDFVTKGVNPKAIIGFNSNALYTLHILYPDSKCQTVRFQLQQENREKQNALLTEKLEKRGILVLDIF